jgi:hypothetical protein
MYPNLTSFTFVTGRRSQNERLRGSVLAIETTTSSGERVLLVRANNPQENLLAQVDGKVLMREVLRVMRELAERRGIKLVVVPLDQASASCSNRQQVANYYQANFSQAPKVELVNEPATNFNGYENWKSTGHSPVVAI